MLIDSYSPLSSPSIMTFERAIEIHQCDIWQPTPKQDIVLNYFYQLTMRGVNISFINWQPTHYQSLNMQ